MVFEGTLLDYLVMIFSLIDISTRAAYSAAQTFYSDLGILAQERGYVDRKECFKINMNSFLNFL